MTDTPTADTSVATTDFTQDTEQLAAGDVIRNYFRRFRKGGDLGLAPAVLALALLTLIFGVVRPESFLSKFNFGNYFTQAAPICVDYSDRYLMTPDGWRLARREIRRSF